MNFFFTKCMLTSQNMTTFLDVIRQFQRCENIIEICLSGLELRFFCVFTLLLVDITICSVLAETSAANIQTTYS